MTYEQAYEDHQYLWDTYGAANDMTGGYVDQEDLALLLAKPTKATAKQCLRNQIQHWFDAGVECGDHNCGTPASNFFHDPRVVEIGERHGCL